MTKCCLKKIFGRARLSHDELVTAVIEVEGVVNAGYSIFQMPFIFEILRTILRLLLNTSQRDLSTLTEFSMTSGDGGEWSTCLN